MKIAHMADIHNCTKHRKWVKMAMDAAIKRIMGEEPDAIVVAGDLLDHGLGFHDPAVDETMCQLLQLADIAPLAVLQGTYSHDRPGSLDPIRHLRANYPICVADEPCQMLLQAGEWRPYGGSSDIDGSTEGDALFSFLPSLNLADPAVMKLGPRAYTESMLVGFEEGHREAINHPRPVPSVLVAHGSVTGCLTESNHALVSPDHEFTRDTLFLSGADAVMLGHIHKHQAWEHEYDLDNAPGVVAPSHQGTRRIAYSGSLARLVHGDHNKKGWLLWHVYPGHSKFELIESPTRQLLEVDYDGIPDMDELKALAAKAKEDDSVRVRWSVDEESRHMVDDKAIKALFDHCESVQAQGSVLKVSSVRAEGISRKHTLGERLDAWLETTGDVDKKEAMAALLQLVQSKEGQEILAELTGKFGGRVAAELGKEVVR